MNRENELSFSFVLKLKKAPKSHEILVSFESYQSDMM